LFGLTTAVSVAEFLPSRVAGPVATFGGGLPALVKLRSAPTVVPAPFVATSR
jgi:hypothetical protein